MKFLNNTCYFMSRSLFKPVFTNYLSKTVVFTQNSAASGSEQGGDVSTTNVSSKEKVSLKKLRIKSFFTFSPKIFQKNISTTSLNPGVGSFGSFLSKGGTQKLISQLPGSEAPLAIFFNNISNIPVSLCGKRQAIYNGKLLMPVFVKRSLLGVSLRHLVRCKRTGRVIHANSIIKAAKKK